MVDVNPLAHRYYLGDLERSARGCPAPRRATARAIEVARRLLHLGALGPRRA